MIAPMNSNRVSEMIAGIALIITGLFLGYNGIWGALVDLAGASAPNPLVSQNGWML